MDFKYLLAGLVVSCFILSVMASNEDNVDVTLSIGNAAPVIMPYAHANVNPVQNGITNTEFVFLITDNNGWTDINQTTMNFTLSKDDYLFFQNCYNNVSVSAVSMNITCNVSFHYYNTAGADWLINVSVKDNSGGLAYNDTQTVTLNTLTAMALDKASITFGTLTLGQTAGATDDPLAFINQGNSNINNVSVKGYSLTGGISSTINCNLINVSDTDEAGTGTSMSNDAMVQLPGITVNRYPAGDKSLYLWIGVPTSGLETASYTSTSSWVVGGYVN